MGMLIEAFALVFCVAVIFDFGGRYTIYCE